MQMAALDRIRSGGSDLDTSFPMAGAASCGHGNRSNRCRRGGAWKTRPWPLRWPPATCSISCPLTGLIVSCAPRPPSLCLAFTFASFWQHSSPSGQSLLGSMVHASVAAHLSIMDIVGDIPDTWQRLCLSTFVEMVGTASG